MPPVVPRTRTRLWLRLAASLIAITAACTGRETGNRHDAVGPDAPPADAGLPGAPGGQGGAGAEAGMSAGGTGAASVAGTAGTSAGSGTGGGGGSAIWTGGIFAGPGYDAWLALDCDCTPERPCPMNCDGIADLEAFNVVKGEYEPYPIGPICDVTLSADDPCPGLRSDGTSAFGACGIFGVSSTFFLWSTVTRSLTRWFDADRRQAGWIFRDGDATICGGVIPDGPGCESSRMCTDDQHPQRCDCPFATCGTPPCPNYARCTQDSDCYSGVCMGSGGTDREPFTCRPATHCSNAVLDGVESDVDCGGLACKACKGGQACSSGTDCQSESCTDGVCDLLELCKDGVRGEFETDVDCGGELFCPPCAEGLHCLAHTDCASGVCSNGACMAVAP